MSFSTTSKAHKAIAITVLVILSLGMIVGLHFLSINIMTSKYNLIKIDTAASHDRYNLPLESKFIDLSEFNMHYMEGGQDDGYPIIFVHGNGSNYTKLEDMALRLADTYKIYMIESRCHGHSGSTDKISYDLMASDIKEFITLKGLDKPVIVGHSDGGINALVTAINYPNLLGGIVSFGANSHPNEFKFYFTWLVKINNVFKPSILNDMMLEQPNITKEQLNSISVPAYIVAGEFDIMNLSDTLFIAQNIPNSSYAIIKGADHSSYVHNGKKSSVLVRDFMEKYNINRSV